MQGTCYVVFSVELNACQTRLVRPWSVGVGVAAAVLLSHQLHIGYDTGVGVPSTDHVLMLHRECGN